MRHKLLVILQSRIGRRNGITAAALATQMDQPERAIRHLVTELREEGVAVCGHPRDGYYIAETAEELEATCAFLRGRAMHSLVIESRMRRISLNELLGQMRLAT